MQTTAPAKADYNRKADGVHDVKDLGPYRSLRFALRRDRAEPGRCRMVLESADQESRAEYDFEAPPPQAWRDVRLDLERPSRTTGSFDRQYTGAVRIELEFAAGCKVWLDDFRLELAR